MAKEHKFMLAGKAPEDLSDLTFPLLMSPKLDGIRAGVRDGKLITRNLKPIKNDTLRIVFERPEYEGLDGEFIVGDPTAEDAFRKTSSVVMSFRGDVTDCSLHAFDMAKLGPYLDRMGEYYKLSTGTLIKNVKNVWQTLAHSPVDVLRFEEDMLALGYEGVMLRSRNGPYKYGRSTTNEGTLLKLKRFCESEATILGLEELMHNDNDKDQYGDRTSHKAGKVPMRTLGALRVVGVGGQYDNVEFSVGTGFDDALRAKIWANRAGWLGRTITVKYFPTGSKDKPRFPVYKGLRTDL